ncbi:hypothetical protein CDAR_498231 [Caerostris darwini]|uniref:Uncharacterized protein n=1 Tax=Caerostris darwini TaxID=1538125 RepID=A0AAV4TZZ9_9ARAC|nr:hypothetical protein CDAR_498231 [Caerostris darwini]
MMNHAILFQQFTQHFELCPSNHGPLLASTAHWRQLYHSLWAFTPLCGIPRIENHWYFRPQWVHQHSWWHFDWQLKEFLNKSRFQVDYNNGDSSFMENGCNSFHFQTY